MAKHKKKRGVMIMRKNLNRIIIFMLLLFISLPFAANADERSILRMSILVEKTSIIR